MRRILAALTIVGLPFGMVAVSAAPASAYECHYDLSEDIHVNCNNCEESARRINAVTRKITGNDEVQCLQ